MLVVPLNIVPFGMRNKMHSIGQLVIINTGQKHSLTGEWKYDGRFEKFVEGSDTNISYILHCNEMFHYREDGALDLIKKFINEFTVQIKQKGLPR